MGYNSTRLYFKWIQLLIHAINKSLFINQALNTACVILQLICCISYLFNQQRLYISMYVNNFIVLCFVMVTSTVLLVLYEYFIPIFQGWPTNTGAVVWLLECQWRAMVKLTKNNLNIKGVKAWAYFMRCAMWLWCNAVLETDFTSQTHLILIWFHHTALQAKHIWSWSGSITLQATKLQLVITVS